MLLGLQEDTRAVIVALSKWCQVHTKAAATSFIHKYANNRPVIKLVINPLGKPSMQCYNTQMAWQLPASPA